MPTPASPRNWKTARRVELPLAACGVPHVITLGRYNHTFARPALANHTHLRAMEFTYLHRGRQTYQVAGTDYHLGGGDIFLTFPNEIHSTGTAPEEKGIMHWLILEIPGPRTRQPFLDLPRARGDALRHALLTLPRRHFRASRKIPGMIEAIFTTYFSPPDPLRQLRLHTQTVTLLLEILASGAGAAPVLPEADDPVFTRLCEWIARSVEEPMPLSVLAQQAGYSLPRFKTWFKERSGLPPAEYLLRARVAAARHRLLHTRAPITQIAHALNFASSQHFATAVKRITGLTPRQIRIGEVIRPSGD